MGNELTQFQRDLIRMWDSLRLEVYKGAKTCAGVSCSRCPFIDMICQGHSNNGVLINAEKAIEIVTQWAKDHPVITMKDKYKEIFGVEPNICPKIAGFTIDCPAAAYCTTSTDPKDCSKCIKSFWNSEYKKWKVSQSE